MEAHYDAASMTLIETAALRSSAARSYFSLPLVSSSVIWLYPPPWAASALRRAAMTICGRTWRSSAPFIARPAKNCCAPVAERPRPRRAPALELGEGGPQDLSSWARHQSLMGSRPGARCFICSLLSRNTAEHFGQWMGLFLSSSAVGTAKA